MNLGKRMILGGLLLLAAGCGKSTSQWTEQMKSSDSVARLHAVHALKGRVNEPQVVVPALIDALKDDDTFIRRDAARALGRFGPEAAPAVPSLNDLFHLQGPPPKSLRSHSCPYQTIHHHR